MEQIGRRYKMIRGESGVYNCTITEQDGSPYILLSTIDNPYYVVNIKSNTYHSKDFYNLNIWRSTSGFFNTKTITDYTPRMTTSVDQYTAMFNTINHSSPICTFETLVTCTYVSGLTPTFTSINRNATYNNASAYRTSDANSSIYVFSFSAPLVDISVTIYYAVSDITWNNTTKFDLLIYNMTTGIETTVSNTASTPTVFSHTIDIKAGETINIGYATSDNTSRYMFLPGYEIMTDVTSIAGDIPYVDYAELEFNKLYRNTYDGTYVYRSGTNSWATYSGTTFKFGLPSSITHEWVEQQYLISVTVVGGTRMLNKLQSIYKSLYYDDWRYDESNIPTDVDSLYKAIEFKAPELLKGIVKDMPLGDINYKEEIISDRVLLVND